MVTPSVPPQRLPVNLVRSGRKQPQREHCVPGCGWWGYHLNVLLQPRWQSPAHPRCQLHLLNPAVFARRAFLGPGFLLLSASPPKKKCRRCRVLRFSSGAQTTQQRQRSTLPLLLVVYGAKAWTRRDQPLRSAFPDPLGGLCVRHQTDRLAVRLRRQSRRKTL